MLKKQKTEEKQIKFISEPLKKTCQLYLQEFQF